jgi:hypothetical protein
MGRGTVRREMGKRKRCKCGMFKTGASSRQVTILHESRFTQDNSVVETREAVVVHSTFLSPALRKAVHHHSQSSTNSEPSQAFDLATTSRRRQPLSDRKVRPGINESNNRKRSVNAREDIEHRADAACTGFLPSTLRKAGQSRGKVVVRSQDPMSDKLTTRETDLP